MAELLASGPPLVYAAIKEIVREAEDMKFQDAMNKITKSQFETVEKLYTSEDQLEGARAFAEKRDPVWKGAKRPKQPKSIYPSQRPYRPCGWKIPIRCHTTSGYAPYCHPSPWFVRWQKRMNADHG